MQAKKIQLTKDIFLMHFKIQKEMALSFLRFQEHYESPRFAGRIFTHQEFREWYRKVKGKFSYVKDWDGFNIPSKILALFYKGKFNPLTHNEKIILHLFHKHKHKFYVVAVHGKEHFFTLKHELAHALFYTNKSYKRKVISIMRKFKLNHIKKELLSLGGYSRKILPDEIQAYTVSLSHELKSEFPEKMRLEIDKVFQKFTPIYFLKHHVSE